MVSQGGKSVWWWLLKIECINVQWGFKVFCWFVFFVLTCIVKYLAWLGLYVAVGMSATGRKGWPAILEAWRIKELLRKQTTFKDSSICPICAFLSVLYSHCFLLFWLVAFIPARSLENILSFCTEPTRDLPPEKAKNSPDLMKPHLHNI